MSFDILRSEQGSKQRALQAVASSSAFKELVRRRSRFVTVALAISVVWFVTFILLTAYAHDFMAMIIVPGLTVAYLLGLSQFVLVWLVTAAYLHASNRTFVPLQQEALAAAQNVHQS